MSNANFMVYALGHLVPYRTADLLKADSNTYLSIHALKKKEERGFFFSFTFSAHCSFKLSVVGEYYHYIHYRSIITLI